MGHSFSKTSLNSLMSRRNPYTRYLQYSNILHTICRLIYEKRRVWSLMSLVPFEHLKKREPNLYSLGRVFFNAPIGRILKQFACFSIDAELESPFLTPSSFPETFCIWLGFGGKDARQGRAGKAFPRCKAS